MFSQITVVGNVGSDPEVRQVGQDVVMSFRLACNEKRGQQEHTEWFRCSVWGKYGQTMAQHLEKGGLVLVTGSLRSSTYQKNDGTAGFGLDIKVESMRLLSSNRREQRQEDTSFPYGASAPQQAYPPQQFMNPPTPQWAPPPPAQQYPPPVRGVAQQPHPYAQHPAVQAAQDVFPNSQLREPQQPQLPNMDPQTGEVFQSPFAPPPR